MRHTRAIARNASSDAHRFERERAIGDSDEEPAIEAAVPRKQGAVAGVRIEAHETTVNHPRCRFWLESDMCLGAPARIMPPFRKQENPEKTVNATLRNSHLFLRGWI
ncbi:hypothetical protein [Burkholderia sp. AW49-1]